MLKGVVGLTGLPGDVEKMLPDQQQPVPDGWYGKLINALNAARGDLELPTSGGIQKTVEGVTGPLYTPQTTAGKYAQTVGEFAPAALGGPESLASRLVGRVVVPATASEGLGELTEGTGAEPIARIGGALLGAGGAAALGRGFSTRAMRAAATPSAEQLDSAVTAGYNDPAIKNLQFTPQAGQDLADQITQQLKANKIDQFNAPGAIAAVERLQTPRFGPALTIDDLEAARQDARANPATASPAEQRAGPIVKSVIDNYLDGNVPQAHLLAGDADAANAALVDARGNAAANFRANDITDALGRAENQAGSTFSGHNLDNATRQQLRPILNQKSGVSKTAAFQDYTPDELAALKGAVNGSLLSNTVRGAGKLLGGGGGVGHIGTGMGAAFTAHEAGADPLTSLGIGLGSMVAGRSLGGIANKLTAAQTEKLAALLRSRSPLGNQMRANAPNVPMPNIRRNLMSSGIMALPSARGQ